MTDRVSEGKRSEIMSKIRGRNTEPELKLMDMLDSAEADYEYQAEIEGHKVDFFLPERKLVIEYRSCFWHFCPEHGNIPESNRKYWEPKLKKNRKRDREKDGELEGKGYRVEIIWSHDDMAERLDEILHKS